MGKLLAVIRREYVERVRNKWFVIGTLFGPLFFGAIMILPGVLSVRGIRNAKVADMVIVDATGTGLGDRVAQRISRNTPPALAEATDSARTTGATGAPPAPVDTAAPSAPVRIDLVAQADLARAESLLIVDVQAERLTGYLVLDSATMNSGQARYAGRNASSVGENEQVETAVRRALTGLRLERAGLGAAAADSIARLRIDVDTERITDAGKGGSGIAGVIFGFVVAFLLYIMLILYGQTVLRGVLEEKTTRVSEVIVASVRPEILLAGKVIGVGAVGLTQFSIWLVSGALLYGERMRIMGAMARPGATAEAGARAASAFTIPTIEPWVLVALVLFFLLGYVFYASLFAAVGSMVNTQEEANQAVQPVMMMLVFSIIFVQPVITNPTGTLALVMSRLPFSAPIIMPLRMTINPVPVYEVALVLAGLAAASLAAIWVSARIYRVGLLMYGKRPTLRELARWIRQS